MQSRLSARDGGIGGFLGWFVITDLRGTFMFGFRSIDRVAWLWLLAGAALLVLAQHGHPDIGIAGWLFAAPLLRFTRSVRLVPGIVLILVVHVLAGAVWVLSIRLPTDTVPWPAIIGAALLSAVLGLAFLVDRLVAIPLRSTFPVLASVVFPLARVALELVVLTQSPFGTVFGSLAASQHGNLPLLQMASITGAYGISFLMAWSGSALCELWQEPRRLLPVGVVATTVAVVLGSGALVLSRIDPGPTVRVAGVTPARSLDEVSADVPPREEAIDDPAGVRRQMAPVTRDLVRSTRREAEAGAKIITWSETATLVHEQDLDSLVQRVGTIAKEYRIRIQITAGVFTERPPHGRNMAILIGPDGQEQWRYDKVHPVPGMESIITGTEPPPVRSTEYGRLAGMICYDLDYPDTSGVEADIVLLPSSDWPGFDRLHTQKARLEAVEQGYAVVRQDAHGTAATFDAHGRTLAAVDYFSTDRQRMSADVPTQGVSTVYAAVGDVFAYGGVAVLAGLIVLSVRVRRRAPGTSGR